VDPLGDRPQRELWNKTRELAPGDVRGPIKRSARRLAAPSVLPGGLERA